MKPTKLKWYYRILLCAVMACVFHSSAYSVPPGYISPYNGFCDENTSADELVKTVRDSDGLIVLPTFRVTMLQNYVHKVNNVTISWAQMPFVTPAWVLWSDTWGLCAYFKDDYGMLAMNGPNDITDQVEMDIWSSMVSGTPSDMFRIIYVDNVTTNGLAPNNCYGCIGVTDPFQKISFVESSYLEKLVMHEWGHTNDCRVYCGGTYSWAASGITHYGPTYDYSHLNIMHPSLSGAGLDGDWSFKNLDYPWLSPNWWDSKRWNENY